MSIFAVLNGDTRFHWKYLLTPFNDNWVVSIRSYGMSRKQFTPNFSVVLSVIVLTMSWKFVEKSTITQLLLRLFKCLTVSVHEKFIFTLGKAEIYRRHKKLCCILVRMSFQCCSFREGIHILLQKKLFNNATSRSQSIKKFRSLKGVIVSV